MPEVCCCLGSLETPGLGCQTHCRHVLYERVNELRRSGLPGACPVCRRESPDLMPVETVFIQAIFCKLQGTHDLLFQALNEVLEIEPNHAGACAEKATCFHMGIGTCQNYNFAAEFYRKALGLYSDMDIDVGPAYNNLGEVYKALGEMEQAERTFRKQLLSTG